VQEELKKSRDKDQMIFHQNKLVSMGEMIQNIAHQWRQPLSQVNSAVLVIDDILQANAINDAILQEKLTEIESLTQYMSDTIDDFKDFFSNSKIKEKFILSDLVQRSIDIVGASLKANGIEITVGVDDKISCFGYPNELQQVVVVMLNNAKDALVSAQTPKPKIEIKIESTIQFNKITICDNANGIADTVIEKIFEPYFTTKHKSQGTGLGLYLSNMIIQESFKGRIEVESSTSGSCFKIFINM
jgi:C4-dicarboxylate-specific signal transduction histidine kinase